MKRITIDNVEEVKPIIQAEIQPTSEVRFQHRLQYFLLVTGGKTCAGVAAFFSDGFRTVQNWAKRFNEDGIEGLQDAARPGRKARLSDQEREVLAQDLRRLPADFGYFQNL